jgi:hypothetical protein
MSVGCGERASSPALSFNAVMGLRLTAALPLDVRKASGLPEAIIDSIAATPLPGRSPCRLREVPVGKAEPFRTSRGKAAVLRIKTNRQGGRDLRAHQLRV